MASKPANNAGRRERPLSPHLSIYKPQITSMMSILHRATGVFNLLGLYVFAGWIATITIDQAAYEWLTHLFTTPIGQAALLAWTASVSYHLLNGVRHLAWDAGYGFEITTLKKTGIVVLLLTAVSVYVLWYIVFGCDCPTSWGGK